MYTTPRIGLVYENRYHETSVDLEHIFYYNNSFNGVPVVFRCRAIQESAIVVRLQEHEHHLHLRRHRYNFDIMWITWFVATACAALSMRGAHSNAGLTSTSFSNELRTGFARLFQNGIEQPLQQTPFVLLNPAEFQPGTGQLVQRPAPFSPLANTGYQLPRPRYELQHLSWVIPYYYVPTRYLPPRGGKRPNDVLVIVVKTRSNCTAPAANGTTPEDGDDGDDGNDEDVSRSGHPYTI